MSNIRVCPNCGKIENQFTFFCTACGWKTELRDEKDAILQVESSSESTGTIVDNAIASVSKDKISEEQEPTTINAIDSFVNQSVVDEPSKSTTNFRYQPLRMDESIEKVEVGVGDKPEGDEYVDIACPHCKAQLSYMKWELQGTLTCPMCNENFSYGEKTVSKVDNEDSPYDSCEFCDSDSFFDTVCPHCNSALSFPRCDFDESELVCPICNQRIAFEDSISYGGAEEREDVVEECGQCDEHIAEIDPIREEEFVDVFCPRCGSKLSFPEWQIKEELVCPMCEATFRMS